MRLMIDIPMSRLRALGYFLLILVFFGLAGPVISVLATIQDYQAQKRKKS